MKEVYPPSDFAIDSLSANPTFGTIPQLLDYLVNGYWGWSGYQGTQSRHWASTNVTVNITGLTATEQSLALSALNAWHEVANISFTLTSGPAGITYNHDGNTVAFCAQTVAGTNLTSATIDISSNWWPDNNIYGYMYQTYLHETAHALGLGHEGPYNNTATYGVDNIFTNDTWQWSIMSYNLQNNFGGATYDYVATPEMVDIYAIQSIYGSTSTRTGDTIYGFNSNAGSIYDFSQYLDQYAGTPALTIYDSGGSDTLDCSGYSVNQIIDLNPGHWSSLGGAVNNIGIYLTTNIENAIGGTGDDVFISNGSLIGTLTGGGGNDTFKATQAGLNLYTISDLSFGDKINFTDASFASFNYAFDGTALRYEGNTIWVSNNPHGAFQVSADTISEVDLTLIPLPPPDLNKVVGPQIMFALTGHTETSEAQFNFHAQYVPQTVSFYANVVHSADPGLGLLRISWLVPLVGYRVPKQFC